ncbi:carboxy-S-adenosyl-L-methionine synthase CmoA [Candidatus Annandia pinicola]|uniref:carboxy-S-adenosyl-L-methionine synthase CmoA n=1 Tax=Candidatus Annandia pinicola TaxID=1345117 RepID=UPI001D00745C|nr:carboxy-S-adenosyl-L-methionine synthase CmoA [Candidatus Annandia pinicola]UDG80380.1 Carboxy-S-adenosyl-L-methionine synthase [Candidatus Annandia pinicola]
MFEKDKIFFKIKNKIKKWSFNNEVSKAFPDMIQRSIPGYNDIKWIISILAKYVVKYNTNVYDLGCSTGNTTFLIGKYIPKNIKYKIIAIDNSSYMIEKINYIFNKYYNYLPIKILKSEIQNVIIKNASLVILNFTLQFIDKKDRQKIINRIYNGLNYNGIFILSEKIYIKDKKINNIISKIYHEFKFLNNYNKIEIFNKENLLKKTMLLDSINIHKNRLKKAGFKCYSSYFQYLNFCSIIAFK